MAYFLPSTLGTPFLKWRTTNYPCHKLPLFCFPSKPSLVSAHFRRPTNRQNYLRKKLNRRQQQLQEVSHNPNPNELDMHELDFDTSVERVKDPDDGKSGESIVWNKLENWVEQYKKDTEFWGLGTHPIFIIYHNSQGKVEKVVVDEAEILRRSRINLQSDDEIGKMDEFNFKLSFAKDLAKEMEEGNNVIPRNSSVAKFLLSREVSNSMEISKDVAIKPGFLSRMSRGGALVLCGVCVVWAIRRILTVKEVDKFSSLEKEMLRRKIKARAEKEQMVKDNVEVVQDSFEPRNLSFKRPHLDKEALRNSILEAAGSKSELAMVEEIPVENKEFEDKLEEIRAMARNAREIERGITSPDDGVVGNYQTLENLSSHGSQENEHPIHYNVHDNVSDETKESEYDTGKSTDESPGMENEALHYCVPNVILPDRADSSMPDMSNNKLLPKSTGLIEEDLHFDGSQCESGQNGNLSRKKFKVITSAKEAREYLSRKNCELKDKQSHKVGQDEQASTTVPMTGGSIAPGNTNQTLDLADEVCESSPLSGIQAFSHFPEDHSAGVEAAEENVINLNNLENSGISVGCEVCEEKEEDFMTIQSRNLINETPSPLAGMAASALTKDCLEDSIMREESMSLGKQNSEDTEKNGKFVSLQVSGTDSLNEEKAAKLSQSTTEENWIEKNFHEFEPILEKIGVGFRENYHVAREKASQELDSDSDMMQLKSNIADDEFEWMKDERLRDIVFKVRDNELSGKDPFHLMEEEDKSLFFHGLEKKVEQVNEKLLKLHEYFHSNIENLDYGADGISIYDPPEKIIPRWKSPPIEKNPEFLDNFFEQRKALDAKSLKRSSLSNSTGNDVVHNPEEPSLQNNDPVVGNVSDGRTKLQKDILPSSKTVIHGSDGSIKKGKRSGKEFWQHTKKWSQGFLESYNAETDPERKAVMKDVGKDLDRWITEKEIQEAANLMDNLPEKGQKYIKQKLDRVKREMELFGPQAVVSKYREYAEEKDEDYLWWLDLPYILCIELYTVENEEERVGLYSLEMAADLELDPKQYHVIAFEDTCACKNLCYIIQAHLEMLGNGNAFVIAKPPKDAFREAKENGFGVTVVRMGELQLNIDQTLEEVEESITEIGSKIFHDKIMKERGVDINALMKGVFGINKSTKRIRSKQELKRGRKP